MAKRRCIYEYPRPAVTVDIIVAAQGRMPKVLLIRRKHDPFVGLWALPGGFVDEGESLEDAARRELREETGLATEEMVQLHTFGDQGRDPRGWTMTVAYLALVERAQRPKAADDAAEARWFSLARLPQLAFDHAKILTRARQYLKDRMP